MNSQDLHNLQEAYLDVYEGTHPDIEGQTEFASKVEAILASRKKRREQDTSTQKHGTLRQEYRDAIRRGEEILAARKAENRARGTQKEQVDLYDIILSHLLDEGYAETPKQAEVIMVNMSEDWRESIMEAMKPLPQEKMKKKIGNIKSSMKSTIEKSANEVGMNPKRVRFPFSPDDREKYSKDEKRVANISKSLNKDK
jgi:hypothetical protein